MNNSRATTLLLVLLWLIILSHQIRPVVCVEKQNNEDKPSMFQLLSNTLPLLKKSHKTYWEKIIVIFHELQLRFTPPSLDFRGTGTGTGTGKGPSAAVGAGEKVKEAVKDSIGTSEAIAKETAKSAAEAIHRTAEKLKGSGPDSGTQESRDEL